MLPTKRGPISHRVVDLVRVARPLDNCLTAGPVGYGGLMPITPDRWPGRPIDSQVGLIDGTDGQNPGLIAIAGLVFAGQAVANVDRDSGAWLCDPADTDRTERRQTNRNDHGHPDVILINSEPAATVVAAEQFIGDVDFATIISGRPPVRATEVALAPLTLRSVDAQVGDSVTLADPNDPSRSLTFKVVGEAVVNDGLSARPGKGAIVTSEAFDAMIQGTLSQTYAVWLDPGVDRAATLGVLRQAFPTTFIDHAVPRQILNLGLGSG